MRDDADEVRCAATAGVDVNAFDLFGGDSPLHWAAGKGQLRAVAALLAAGADVNAKSRRTAKEG